MATTKDGAPSITSPETVNADDGVSPNEAYGSGPIATGPGAYPTPPMPTFSTRTNTGNNASAQRTSSERRPQTQPAAPQPQPMAVVSGVREGVPPGTGAIAGPTQSPATLQTMTTEPNSQVAVFASGVREITSPGARATMTTQTLAPTTVAANPIEEPAEHRTTMSKGAIGGTVGAVMILCILLLALAACIIRQRRARRQRGHVAEDGENVYSAELHIEDDEGNRPFLEAYATQDSSDFDTKSEGSITPPSVVLGQPALSVEVPGDYAPSFGSASTLPAYMEGGQSVSLPGYSALWARRSREMTEIQLGDEGRN